MDDDAAPLVPRCRSALRSERAVLPQQGRATAASDLLQSTFLACVESRENFCGESGFRMLLFAVARNLLFKHDRTHRGPSGRIDSGEVSACDLDSERERALARERGKLLLA